MGIAACCILVLVAGAASGAQSGRDRELAAALAYVKARCPEFGGEVNRSQWEHGWPFNALYGWCLQGNGRDQHVWFFIHGRFVGKDVKKGSSKEILGMWRDGTTIAFMYVLYRLRDPGCCATGGGKIVRYRWRNGRVVRLDPLPPVQDYSGSIPVGR